MGVSPAADEIDQDYLSVLAQSVDMMSDYGIYALMDSHQDLMSRYYCGAGVPDWIAKRDDGNHAPFPQPIAHSIPVDPQTQYPLIPECLKREFAFYYLTDAVGSLFQALYENKNGTQDEFVKFWAAVAQSLSQKSNLLGYEIINEPALGDVIRNPALVVELGKTDRDWLFPMYQRVHEAIRKYDTDHNIFYEPCVFDPTWSGFTEGLDGAAYNDRQVYSFHAHCLDVNKREEPQSKLLCDIDDKGVIEMRVAEGRKKKMSGMMLMEFRALSAMLRLRSMRSTE
eukprot:ANDGO_06649.mRNA.1 Endoglycoceramidase